MWRVWLHVAIYHLVTLMGSYFAAISGSLNHLCRYLKSTRGEAVDSHIFDDKNWFVSLECSNATVPDETLVQLRLLWFASLLSSDRAHNTCRENIVDEALWKLQQTNKCPAIKLSLSIDSFSWTCIAIRTQRSQHSYMSMNHPEPAAASNSRWCVIKYSRFVTCTVRMRIAQSHRRDNI